MRPAKLISAVVGVLMLIGGAGAVLAGAFTLGVTDADGWIEAGPCAHAGDGDPIARERSARYANGIPPMAQERSRRTAPHVFRAPPSARAGQSRRAQRGTLCRHGQGPIDLFG